MCLLTNLLFVCVTRVQVRRLTRDDGGAYMCLYKNSVGQVSHIMKLVLEGKTSSLARSCSSLIHYVAAAEKLV